MMVYVVFFFNDTATTEIYTLSLHDALPISQRVEPALEHGGAVPLGLEQGERLRLVDVVRRGVVGVVDRKSTRLNSSHANISYAVFCLKKKNLITAYTPQMGLIIRVRTAILI